MLFIKMKTIASLVFLFLMKATAAPTRKAECQDQYRHCPEWSRDGYCDKTGYKTYMTFMCAYSCNTCQDQKLRKESQDVSSASVLEAGQLQNPEDIHETTFEKDEDEASANEPISGEGEIRGDGESSEDKEEDRLQHEQRKDAALEWQKKGMQSLERQQRQNTSGENEEIQEAKHRQAQNENLQVSQDQDPPGVHLIKFQGTTIDDDVNPRSKISTRLNENLKPLIPQTQIENTGITEGQGEDVTASGSLLIESGDSEGDESNSSSPVAEPKGTSKESQEMKDIAGDIKTGSKIFEADISEPDSASGCSSGFGCSSGNEEEIQTEKNQEAVELEPRSKIATVPQIKDAKSQQADKNIEIEHRQTSAVSDTASGSVAVLRDDVSPEDDIAGAKSEAESNTKRTSKVSQTQEDILESVKTVKEDVEMSAEISDSGSGADVHDDIQGQSVRGANNESLVGRKSAANGDASSGSDADTTSESELLKQVKTTGKNDAEIKRENGQKQEKTANSEQADKESISESNATNQKIPGQNEAIKNAAVKSIPPDQNQSESENYADNEEMNTEGIRNNNETSKAKNEYNMRTNTKEENNQQDKITKSATANPSAAKNDVGSNELVGKQQHVINTGSGSQPAENSKLDADDDEQDTNTHTEANPNDNQNGANIDTEYLESDKKTDVKDKAVGANENQETTQNDTEKYEGEESDTFSGSGAASIDGNIDTDGNLKRSNGATVHAQPTDIDEIEDALFSKEDKSIDNQKLANDENQDLSSPAAKRRITSMEKLIRDDKPKAEKVKDISAKTRETVPSADTTLNDLMNADLGKGRIVRLILDQHYYKPYSNEDSMAYEMLALDLKKEVERAVGNQAIVSQISFSEIRKPGKLPRYSRVLAKFMLHGDTDTLHGAVRKGVVGDLMVDKKFFQAS